MLNVFGLFTSKWLKASGISFQPFSFIVLFICIVWLVPLKGQTIKTDLEDSIQANYWINLNIIESTSGHSGTHFVIANPDSPYGLGYEGGFPEVVANQNVRMQFKGWVKSNRQNDQALFIITLQQDNKQVFWTSVDLGKLLDNENEWVSFSKAIDVPASITKSGKIKAFLWNNDSRDTIAIDDLELNFKKLDILSNLPVPEEQNINYALTSDRLILSNNFYSLYYSDEKKAVSLYSPAGERIIDQFMLYSEAITEGFYKSKYRDLELIDVVDSEAGKVINFESGDATIRLNCFDDSEEIKIVVKKTFMSEALTRRETFIIQSGQNVSKVYRSNRKVDTSDFQNEYWLSKQGVQFGTSENCWFIYHPVRVSSLQLSIPDNRLWINLDFEKDHPFLHFPLDDGSRDVKIDQSASIYQKGDTLESEFILHVGKGVGNIPRLMKNPAGFLSAYIWTEHADFTDIRTNRATYFGSEEIKKAADATGGFVRYNIPVTKSVFYFNPDGVTNTESSNGLFTNEESTIKGDRKFRSFLFQLNKLDYEICLHSPEQYTSTVKAMKKSLKYTGKKFSSPTWIDHGYNNGKLNNREDLVCDGANPGSEHFALEMWNVNNVRYFWNPYYEDYYSFDTLQFGEMLSKPYHGYGDHVPDPDFWQHNTRTKDLYHWPTKSVTYVERDDLWNYYYSDIVLQDFADGWCVQFNHCYPAWVDPEKGFWHTDEKGIIKARDGFNVTLEKMANLRAEGLLNLTTVRDFMNYRLSTENVSYKYLVDGDIAITNYGSEMISSLSFAALAENVLVDGKRPQQKFVGHDIVFWFDLGPGETKIISLDD